MNTNQFTIDLAGGLTARLLDHGLPPSAITEICTGALRQAVGFDEELLHTHLDLAIDTALTVRVGGPLGEMSIKGVPVAHDHQAGTNGLWLFNAIDDALVLTDGDGWTLGTYDHLGQAAQHGCASIDLIVQAAERLGVDVTITPDADTNP